MKVSCPRCGRRATLEEEAGDFPTRCTRCGTLVRRPMEGAAPAGGGLSTQIEGGMLAGMLTARRMQETPTIIRARGDAFAQEEVSNHGVLRPESRREILKARERQVALTKATLRGNQEALGALTWAGLALVGVLALGALALKAHAMYTHPKPLRADVLQISR